MCDNVQHSVEAAKEKVGHFLHDVQQDLHGGMKKKDERLEETADNTKEELQSAHDSILDNDLMTNLDKSAVMATATAAAAVSATTTATALATIRTTANRTHNNETETDSLRTSTPEPEIEKALANIGTDEGEAGADRCPPTPEPHVAELEHLNKEMEERQKPALTNVAAAQSST